MPFRMEIHLVIVMLLCLHYVTIFGLLAALGPRCGSANEAAPVRSFTSFGQLLVFLWETFSGNYMVEKKLD